VVDPKITNDFTVIFKTDSDGIKSFIYNISKKNYNIQEI